MKFFLLLIVFAFVFSEYLHTKSFSVEPDMKNRKATVKLGHVTCDLKFSTSKCEEKKKEAIIANTNDYSPLKQLIGECLTKVHGYWEYRICFGDKIRQFHQNDEYILGKYNPDHDLKDTQLYDEGQKCPNSVRKTTVKYMCGNQKEIVSIIEPKECVYEMIVTHHNLCYPGSPFQTYSGQHVSEVKNSDDHWFMSLEKSVGGQYICSVYTILRDIKDKSQVCFSKVGIQVGSEKSGKISIKQVVNRKSGRKIVEKDEFEIIKGEANSMAVLNTPKFDGSLEYSKVIFTFDS